MNRSQRQNFTALMCVVPAVIYFLFFTLPPVYMLIRYSFTDLKITLGQETYVGLKNYINIFKYSEYFDSIKTTIIMAFFLVVFGFVISFGVALLLNSIKKLKVFFRTLWYIPVLLAMPVISKLISYMLWSEGPLNVAIKALGGKPVEWFASTFWMYFWIVFLVIWKNIGSSAILFIAGLNGINPELYESAKIDGAGRAQMLFKITIPLMRPIFGFAIINAIIGALGTFEPVKLISGGAPGSSTMTIMYRIYDEAFKNFKQGFASALSVIVFLLTFILTLLSMKFTDNSIVTGKRED